MRIAVLGTGSMGSALAEGLAAAGHVVTVFNRTRSKAEALEPLGIRAVPNAADAIRDAEGVLVALLDAAAIAAIVEDPLVKAALPGSAILSVAMISAQQSADVNRRITSLGGRFSEAAIAVYPHDVRSRQCQSLLAACPEHRDFWRAILSDLGTVFDLEHPGDATSAYIAMGCAYMFQTVTMAHGLAAFARMQLPTSVMAALLDTNPSVGMSSASALVPDMLARRYGTASFSIDNFIAMAQQVTDAMRAVGLPTRLLESISDLYQDASRSGMGNLDVTAIYELLAPPK
jgi:3-hydroxyisobutyrate dehydrogenase-like beta-hydroxyacid dehydrogenase